MKCYFPATSLAFILLMVLFQTSCKNKNQSWQQGPPELPFATIQNGSATTFKEYTASIEGITNVEIRPQATGYLTRILVEEGAYVHAGQTLFVLDDRVYQEQLKSAQALLMSAQANLTTAKINLDRKKELAEAKIVSELQVQEATANYNAARGSVEQAQASIGSAKVNINFAAIKAPVSGYVGRFNYRLGSLLTPSNAQAITVLSDNRQIYAYFSLSEADFVSLQRQYTGTSIQEKLKSIPSVSLLLADGTTFGEKGKIDAVEGQFNKTTGSIALRAKFNNPGLTLRSGNTGKIQIDQEYAGVMLVPISSTVTIQDKIYIYSVDTASKLIQLPIDVSGKADKNFIVTGGVKPGDKYIVSGFERLQPGTPVTEQKGQPKGKADSWK